jgi:hypothetical protein
MRLFGLFGQDCLVRIEMRPGNDDAMPIQGWLQQHRPPPTRSQRYVSRSLLLARDPVNSPLTTGDIVTTGTLTRALPITPGESWSTVLHGIELAGRPVWFA